MKFSTKIYNLFSGLYALRVGDCGFKSLGHSFESSAALVCDEKMTLRNPHSSVKRGQIRLTKRQMF